MRGRFDLVSAEAYVVWNAVMCLCSLPLGGKLAGLPAPGCRQLALVAGLSGASALVPMLASRLSPLALLSLPGAVGLCFFRHGMAACLRCLLMTLCASFLSGGAMTALMGGGMPPFPAGIFTAALCLSTYLLTTLLPGALCNVRQVELRVGDRAVILPAMLDSGNLLSDPITGLPVLVIPLKAGISLFPEVGDFSCLSALPLGFRLLNVRTAAGSSLLPMFRPDECRIFLNGSACKADLLVAITGREYGGVQALVPLSALPAGALPN